MNGNNIPKWKLEWYLAGALEPQESEAIVKAMRNDEDLRTRVEALSANNAAILAKYPPNVMFKKVNAARVARQTQRSWNMRSRAGFHKWTIPAFVCATLLITIPVQMVLNGGAQESPEPVYATRTKGELSSESAAYGVTNLPSLEVWRKAGDNAEKLAPEADVSAGDIVQLRYIAPDSCYGAILSVDGRGVLTVHLSGKNNKAAPLTPGRPVALKQSYKLDDAPAFEAFYLITAQDDFSLESIKRRMMTVKHPIDNEQNLQIPEKQLAAFTLRKSNRKGVN